MSEPSDTISVDHPIAIRGALLMAIGAALCMIVSGCFLPRSPSLWSRPVRADARCAVLPVLSEQVRLTVEIPDSTHPEALVNVLDKMIVPLTVKIPDSTHPYEISAAATNVRNMEDVARSINEVFDTIAGDKESPLQGPREVEAVLKRSPQWGHLLVYLQDPGPSDEPWKVEGIAAVLGQLGLQRVLIVTPILRFTQNIDPMRPHQSSPQIGHHWSGMVQIELTMLDLSTGRESASGRGEASFYGYVGVIIVAGYGGGAVIPYAFGKTFHRGVDQAARSALENLFDNLAKEQPFQ